MKRYNKGYTSVNQLGALYAIAYMILTTYMWSHRDTSPFLLLIALTLVMASLFLLTSIIVSRWPVPSCFRASVKYLWRSTVDQNWSIFYRILFVVQHLLIGY